mmetsp:Transcript_80258/g.126569  ORF Transcript_80258/g.126569 Transcript_80258/m.126569 type:complete len:145 (+) Transcript_80258:65-499(+)
MSKRAAATADKTEFGADVFVMGLDGVCHGSSEHVTGAYHHPTVDLTRGYDEDVEMDQQTPKRHCATSPCSTAASTPTLTATSPEARAKAQTSNFASLSVKQLKQRIVTEGGSFAGMSEKTELVAYLDMLTSLKIEHDEIPLFEL